MLRYRVLIVRFRQSRSQMKAQNAADNNQLDLFRYVHQFVKYREIRVTRQTGNLDSIRKMLRYRFLIARFRRSRSKMKARSVADNNQLVLFGYVHRFLKYKSELVISHVTLKW